MPFFVPKEHSSDSQVHIKCEKFSNVEKWLKANGERLHRSELHVKATGNSSKTSSMAKRLRGSTDSL